MTRRISLRWKMAIFVLISSLSISSIFPLPHRKVKQKKLPRLPAGTFFCKNFYNLMTSFGQLNLSGLKPSPQVVSNSAVKAWYGSILAAERPVFLVQRVLLLHRKPRFVFFTARRNRAQGRAGIGVVRRCVRIQYFTQYQNVVCAAHRVGNTVHGLKFAVAEMPLGLLGA